MLENATPVAQGDVRDELEELRDREAEAVGGYSDAQVSQQDAAIAAAESIVDKAEFHGSPVIVTMTGHVAEAAGEADAVSVLVSGPVRGTGA